MVKQTARQHKGQQSPGGLEVVFQRCFLETFQILKTRQLSVKKKELMSCKHLQLSKVQHLPRSHHRPNRPFPIFPPSFFIPLLFPPLFPWLPHPVLHQFAGLFRRIQKQQASPLWTGGKHASQKKKKKTEKELSHSLSMVIEFLNIFSKSA